MRSVRYLFVVTLLCTGCTAFQTQENTLKLGQTVENIETHQIRRTLTLYVEDPDRVPFLIALDEGQAAVKATVASNWQFTNIASSVFSATQSTSQRTLGFGPPITGEHADAWKIKAVNDAADLTRLRCLFGYTVYKSHNIIAPDTSYEKYAKKMVQKPW